MARNWVLKKDEQGRPVDVQFDGDPARQCPACLSENVEPFPAIGMTHSDADPRRAVQSWDNHRLMKCLDCGGRWWRPGI